MQNHGEIHLIAFAESNKLLLVCPDGGPDGRIDDPIDTAFTSVLLDSIGFWYNINRNEQYVMGFSWGGKTSYTYGLRNTEKFKGYLIIGAAINGTGEINNILENAEDESFYLIHGSADLLAARFTPLFQALQNNEACVESNVLQGVGHTIDFPMRNQIMTDGFNWLGESSCNLQAGIDDIFSGLNVHPNPSHGIINIQDLSNKNMSVKIFDINGRSIPFTQKNDAVILHNPVAGLYFLHLRAKNQSKALILYVQ